VDLDGKSHASKQAERWDGTHFAWKESY